MLPLARGSLRREDVWLTRLREIVVQTDDLALSVDVPPAALPDEAFPPVLELLTRLAVGRHDQSAVDRHAGLPGASRNISAFLEAHAGIPCRIRYRLGFIGFR